MEDTDDAHRPGVVIIDDLRVGLADLDSGEVIDVEPDLAAILIRPELALRGGSTAARAVSAVDRAPAPRLPPGTTIVVDGPVALRVDAGRLLAWDHNQRAHVPLEQDHLVVLSAARTPASTGDLAMQVSEVDRVAGELLSLGLIRAESTWDDVPEAAAEPTPVTGNRLEGGEDDG